MTPGQAWRGGSRAEQPPRTTRAEPQVQRATVRIGLTLDRLHKTSKASHYETGPMNAHIARHKPRLKGAKLRPPEFLCRPHL
jgi:hypothetical protein